MTVEKINSTRMDGVSPCWGSPVPSFRDLMMAWGSHVSGGRQPTTQYTSRYHNDLVCEKFYKDRKRDRYNGSHFHLRSQGRSLSTWRLTLELSGFWSQVQTPVGRAFPVERAASAQLMHCSLCAHPVPRPLLTASLGWRCWALHTLSSSQPYLLHGPHWS